MGLLDYLDNNNIDPEVDPEGAKGLFEYIIMFNHELNFELTNDLLASLGDIQKLIQLSDEGGPADNILVFDNNVYIRMRSEERNGTVIQKWESNVPLDLKNGQLIVDDSGQI